MMIAGIHRALTDEVASRRHVRSDRCSRASRMIRACRLSQFHRRFEQCFGLIRVLVGARLLPGLLAQYAERRRQ